MGHQDEGDVHHEAAEPHPAAHHIRRRQGGRQGVCPRREH